MDGNGRWAERRNKPRVVGHRAGARRVREITTACAKRGIEQLTLYAFSVENWQRSRTEINALMNLLGRYLATERPTMMKNNIRFRTIGRIHDLPKNAVKEIRKNEKITESNTGMTLCLALSYGGRAEIIDAAREIAEAVQNGRLDPAGINDELFAQHLYTAGMTDPDLLIRTAGEMRVSNFLLWQISYAELYITPVLWPDFDEAELDKAIAEFSRRERKFGAVKPQETS